MKRMKRGLIILLSITLATGALSTAAYAQAPGEHDTFSDEWNFFDLFAARPLAVGAGIVGTGLFILSLPFTIPTGSTDAAAKIFITNPFRFAFDREFPDREVRPDGYGY